jgi:hypothetical protein
MDAFLNYISQFEPTFANSIKGANPSEITSLEDLVGRPLPSFYRSFLSRMGYEIGGITIGYDTTTNILEVISYYKNYIITGLEMLPPNCIVISVGGLDLNVCLQCSDNEEPRVVYSEGDEIYMLYAESLKKLLFRITFMKYEPKLFPYSTSYWNSNTKRMFESARRMALDLKFSQHWFSDDVAFCGMRDGGIISISQYEGHGTSIIVSAQSKAEVDRTGNFFMNQFGVKPLLW